MSKRSTGPINRAKNRPQYVPSDPLSMNVSPVPGSGVDERKVVIADKDIIKEADFEDKVWFYGRQYKSQIIITIVLVFAVILGANGWRLYKNSRADELGARFAAAQTADEKAAFAAEYPGTTMAGVALLENADSAFAAGNFAAAAASYEAAAESLGKSSFQGRALLGAAVSKLKAGDAEAGRQSLLALAQNPAMGVYAAEAGYHLGFSRLAAEDTDGAKAAFEGVTANPNAGYWSVRANEQLQRLGSNSSL